MKKLIAASAMSVALSFGGALAVPVDVELQLLVDVSASVSPAEFDLQRDGYVAAFQSSTVQNAILNGDIGSIAVQLIYWSQFAVVAVDWTLIDSAATANAFATSIGNAARPPMAGADGVGMGTGIANAIDFGVSEFDFGGDNDFEGTELVMDVSGDGTENIVNAQGSQASADAVAEARDNALGAGVTSINGLPILGEEAGIVAFYTANVIGGDDPFVIPASSFGDFEPAITQKLAAEITGTNPVPLPMSAWLLLSTLGLFGLYVKLRKTA
ncbi:MAG: DUF1194 domain-containing protein [Pseudomonadota bacterium]